LFPHFSTKLELDAAFLGVLPRVAVGLDNVDAPERRLEERIEVVVGLASEDLPFCRSMMHALADEEPCPRLLLSLGTEAKRELRPGRSVGRIQDVWAREARGGIRDRSLDLLA
jgi:hypothetical protein